jgi:hypothetical protein
MALKEDLIKLSMIQLGHAPSGQEDDLFKNISNLYEFVKEDLLVRYTWKFALYEQSLGKGKKQDDCFLHLLPKDMLKIHTIVPARSFTVIDKNTVLRCQAEEVSLLYVRKLEDDDLPIFFRPLLVCSLAAASAVLVTQSDVIARKWELEAARRLSVAIAIDNAQYPSPSILSNPLYRAHF